MILQIDNNKNVEKPIREYTFSELDIKEREHIEEWIEEYPEMLGEDLLIIAKEYDAFDKTNNRLDLLAIDKNGKLVIIELKRDIADRFSDLQAIHYAAYCSTFNLEQVVEIMAEYTNKTKEESEERIINFIDKDDFADFDNQPRIFIVSRDYQEETLAAVLWLRDSGIDINCVKLEPYKIEDNIVVNSDILIPLPEAKDFMIHREQKKINTATVSQQQRKFIDLWSKLLEKFNHEKPDVTWRKPGKEAYFPIRTGYSSIHFEWLVRGRPLNEFLVALHFEKSNYNENLALLNFFSSKKDEIQKKFPNEEVIFDKHFLKKYTQIYIKSDNVDFDDENIDWAFKNMIKLYDVLKPYLDVYFSE